MHTFTVAGAADDPALAEAELLGDLLVKSFPCVSFAADMRHPCEWPEFRAKLCRLHGFASPGTAAVVWRRDGRLVGTVADFVQVVKDAYGLELSPEIRELVPAITAENQANAAQAAKEDAWTPYLGRARKEWSDGIIFDGIWKDHAPVKGAVKFPDGSTFEGSLKGGRFHGHGKRTFPDGSKFVGQFREGRREGTGKYCDAVGNSYDGSYSAGQRTDLSQRVGRPRTPCHGRGTRTWPSGRQYTGDWENNEATGRGIEVVPIDNTSTMRQYTGSFENGKYHGQGFMQYGDGDSYDGAWVKGIREGPGIYTWADKILTFDGIFENDVPTSGVLRCEGSVNCQGEATGKKIDYTTFFPGEIKLGHEDMADWQRMIREKVLGEGGWLDHARMREAKTETYDDYPIKDSDANTMSRVLTRKMWTDLRARITENGVTLHSCIAPGLDTKDTLHPLGLRASDPDCYAVFRELFDGVIGEEQKGFRPVGSAYPPTDFADKAAWQNIKSFSPEVMQVATCWKLQIDRSIGNIPGTAIMNNEDRRRVESMVACALLNMGKMDESLRGAYFPIQGSDSWEQKMGGMSDSEAEKLTGMGAAFSESECFDSRDWPNARGIFVTDNQRLVVHINKAEHVSFFCLGSPGEAPADFKEMFKTIQLALDLVESHIFENEQIRWARSDNLGFLLTSLDKVGTGMTIELMTRIPKLAKQSIDFISRETGVTLTKVPLEQKKPTSQQEFALSVPRTLGTPEVDILNTLIVGANEICKHEKTLASDRKKMWLLEEAPKVLLLGIKEALADDSAFATKLAQEFDLDVISPQVALQAEIDKGTKLGQTAQWYQEAGKPATRQVVAQCIVNLITSNEVKKTRFAGGARGWVCSGFPASTEEVEMLLKADVKPNKIINLKPTDAAVQQATTRLLSRRRDKFRKQAVFYLEDEPGNQAAERKDSSFEKLAEDRGNLAANAATEYKTRYETFSKTLHRLGQSETLVVTDADAALAAMISYLLIVPGVDGPVRIYPQKLRLRPEKA